MPPNSLGSSCSRCPALATCCLKAGCAGRKDTALQRSSNYSCCCVNGLVGAYLWRVVFDVFDVL
eukprot:13205252-Alexandrium_andersonii.AAC.1